MAESTYDRFERLLRQAMETLTLETAEGSEGCPDEGKLAAYVDGRLGGEELERMQDHLSRCRRCLDVVLAAVQAGTASKGEACIPEGMLDRLQKTVIEALPSAQSTTGLRGRLRRLWQGLSSITSYRLAMGAVAVAALIFIWILPGLYRELTWKPQVEIAAIVLQGGGWAERGRSPGAGSYRDQDGVVNLLIAPREETDHGLEEISLGLKVNKPCLVYVFFRDWRGVARLLIPTPGETPPELPPLKWKRLAVPEAIGRGTAAGSFIVLAVSRPMADLAEIEKLISASDDPVRALRRKMGKMLLGIKIIRIRPLSVS